MSTINVTGKRFGSELSYNKSSYFCLLLCAFMFEGMCICVSVCEHVKITSNLYADICYETENENSRKMHLLNSTLLMIHNHSNN